MKNVVFLDHLTWNDPASAKQVLQRFLDVVMYIREKIYIAGQQPEDKSMIGRKASSISYTIKQGQNLFEKVSSFNYL